MVVVVIVVVVIVAVVVIIVEVVVVTVDGLQWGLLTDWLTGRRCSRLFLLLGPGLSLILRQQVLILLLLRVRGHSCKETKCIRSWQPLA